MNLAELFRNLHRLAGIIGQDRVNEMFLGHDVEIPMSEIDLYNKDMNRELENMGFNLGLTEDGIQTISF